ncbi:MAG: hypothetical protein ACRD2X_22530 [Vicinamibacteraceae bacterium]
MRREGSAVKSVAGHRVIPAAAVLLAIAVLAAPAQRRAARTLTVCPTGCSYAQLSTLFAQEDLGPGDVVNVRGDATYAGGIALGDNDDGADGNPVRVRWDRSGVGGATPPRLQGGRHTIAFEGSNYVVLEGFDVTGGSSSCVLNAAHAITVRDSVIHDCPSHGLLGADHGSGSFTLEYSEVYNAGAGQTRHAIYMASDAVAHPAAVFRMRFNYVHNGLGGNLIKSRQGRNEIHYNWIEGAAYQELELIGPDCEAWNGAPPDIRTYSDVVGNVVIHTSAWNNVIRAGGDLNGRSRGLLRLVGNTIVVDRAAGGANAVLVQLGLEGVEMQGNAIFQGGGAAPVILAENQDVDDPICGFTDRRPWVDGVRRVFGANNWVEVDAARVPREWNDTLRGADPLFADAARRLLRPLVGSALVDAAATRPPSAPDFRFPLPLARPMYEPPLRAKLAPAGQRLRLPVGGRLDIGALESLAAH